MSEKTPQEQASNGIGQIYVICMILEATQILCALAIAGSTLLARNGFISGFLYSSMLTLSFLGIAFAHAVVFYVFHAIARNIHTILIANPSTMIDRLFRAVRANRTKVAPLMAIHIVLTAILLILAWTPQNIGSWQIATAWVSFVVSCVCFAVVYLSLRSNSRQLTSFLEVGSPFPSDLPDSRTPNA